MSERVDRGVRTGADSHASGVDVTLDLLRRYDKPGPRYTSYPTAVEFGPDFDEAEYRRRLELAAARTGEPLSLYVHVPFCEARCTYCGCNVVVTPHDDVVGRYLGYLETEIDMLAAAIGTRRPVSQLHWGGGTPTRLTPQQMTRLHGRLAERFRLQQDAELAVEIDPRVTDAARLKALRDLGFNRISMGVQDLSPAVQEAIGRGQTRDQTREVYDGCRELGFESINFDLVYGLPEQTEESFAATIREVAEMRPDRVAVYSFAHVPWLMPHQKKIDVASLPDPETKLRLFCIARHIFLDSGYASIGMDHFALPADELVRAMRERRLGRNFMGYTVRMGADMLGLGLSSIGEVAGSFVQNAKKLSLYQRAIEAGRFPVERGYALDGDDRIRQEVIARLMCNFYLDRGEIEKRFGIDFADYFAAELAELAAADGPVAHGFLKIGGEALEVVGPGRMFVRNICMVFDRHLREKRGDRPTFSRTV